MNFIIRLIKSPFTKHEYDFENAECTSIQPGINPSQAFLTFHARCKYCTKKIKVDYDKYHGLLPLSEKFGCLKSRTAPAPKPETLHFSQREPTDLEIKAREALNTQYSPYDKGDISIDEPYEETKQ